MAILELAVVMRALQRTSLQASPGAPKDTCSSLLPGPRKRHSGGKSGLQTESPSHDLVLLLCEPSRSESWDSSAALRVEGGEGVPLTAASPPGRRPPHWLCDASNRRHNGGVGRITLAQGAKQKSPPALRFAAHCSLTLGYFVMRSSLFVAFVFPSHYL
jgi:hypothetical protein